MKMNNTCVECGYALPFHAPTCSRSIRTPNPIHFSDEIVSNEHGAKQSRLDYRFDLLDADTLFRLAAILDYGATRYGDNNWRGLPTKDHVNHALAHIFGHVAGDTSEDHLGHALCRLMFACATSNVEAVSKEAQALKDIAR